MYGRNTLILKGKKRQRVIVNLSFDYEFKDGSFIDYAEVSRTCKKDNEKIKNLNF